MRIEQGREQSMKAKQRAPNPRVISKPLKSLLAQRVELDRQMAQLESEEREGVITRIRLAIRDYGLTAADFTSPARASKPAKKFSALRGTKAPIKFRNASSGESWSGRGPQPRWLKAAPKAGQQLSDFAV